jgi:D-sedoheptulose 7-phosphate isomerase
MPMTQATDGDPGLDASQAGLSGHTGPGSAGLGRQGLSGQGLSRQHIGALVGALSVLDTRLLDTWGQRLATLTRQGGRLLVAGNGASAVQAAHLAAQVSRAAQVTGAARFTGHAAAGRRDCPAIALHAAAPAATATARDASGHEEVFARQVRSLGRPGDVLLAMSTSGRYHSLLRAVAAARAGGIVAWCLTGPAPNPLADVCDEVVCVYPAGARALSLTATVQEAHQVALHLICLSFNAASFDAASFDAASFDGASFDAAPADVSGRR